MNNKEKQFIRKGYERFKRQYFEILTNLFQGTYKGKEMRMTEGRNSAIAILKKRFGTDEYIKSVLDIDPTPQKKYSEWIAKQIINSGNKYTDHYELEGLGMLIQSFHNLLEKGKVYQEYRDINKIDDIEMLEDVVYQAEQNVKNESGFTKAEEATIKSNESNIVVDNAQVTVVEPLTHNS
jgi:uncharacterized protein YerC